MDTKSRLWLVHQGLIQQQKLQTEYKILRTKQRFFMLGKLLKSRFNNIDRRWWLKPSLQHKSSAAFH